MQVVRAKDKKVFKSVPTAVGLFIAEDGEARLFDKEFGHNPSKGNYMAINHGIDNLTIARHRLVAMAWKELPENYKELDVNHLDNTPGNDWASNLEWCTRSENIAHGVNQGRYNNTVIYSKAGKREEVVEWPSMTRAAKGHGLTASHIGFGLSGSELYIHKSGIAFSKSKRILEEHVGYSRAEILTHGKPVVQLGSSEGSVVERRYDTMDDMIKDNPLNLAPKTIEVRIRNDGSEAFGHSKILFELDGELLSVGPRNKPVVGNAPMGTHFRSYNILTNVEAKHPSLSQMAIDVNTSVSSLATAFKGTPGGTFRPHYRLTKDPNLVFPTELSFNDIARIANMHLVKDDGNVVLTAKTGREYAQKASEAGFGGSSHIRKNKESHQAKLRREGYDVHYNVSGVSFKTDDFKTITRV